MHTNFKQTIVFGLFMLAGCGSAPTGSAGSALAVATPDNTWTNLNPESCQSAFQPNSTAPCIYKITFDDPHSVGIHWEGKFLGTTRGWNGYGFVGVSAMLDYNSYNLRWGPLSVDGSKWLQGNFGADVHDVELNSLEDVPYGVIVEGEEYPNASSVWSSWSPEVEFLSAP
jgi:hypothetical protein